MMSLVLDLSVSLSMTLYDIEAVRMLVPFD